VRRRFAERGFEAVTVAEVAREAGLAEKTVFNYFPTKEDLFYSDLEAFEEELIGAIRGREPGKTALDAFADFMLQPRGVFALETSTDFEATERLRTITRVITESPALLARERQGVRPLHRVARRPPRRGDAHIAGQRRAGGRRCVDAGSPPGADRLRKATDARRRERGRNPARLRSEARRALELLERGLGDYARKRG
jgi:AcrR family transcriptional regulator